MTRNGKKNRADKKADENEVKKDSQEGVLSQWGCPWGDAYVGTEVEVRGHILGRHFSKAPSGPTILKEPASPDPDENIAIPRRTFESLYEKAVGATPKPASGGGLSFDDSLLTEPVPSALAIQQEAAKSAQLERVRLSAERDAMKAQADIERMSSGSSEVDALRRELDSMKEQMRLKDQQMFQQQMRAEQSAFQAQITGGLTRIETAIAQRQNGHSTDVIGQSIALANAINGQRQDPIQTGLMIADRLAAAQVGAPPTELAAKYALTAEKMKADNALAMQREAQQARTQERLFELGTHAVDTVAAPFVQGAGANRAAAPVPSDPAAQVKSLDDLIARASAARELVLAKLQAAGPPGADPIAAAQQAVAVQDPIAASVARSVQFPPSPSPSGGGTGFGTIIRGSR